LISSCLSAELASKWEVQWAVQSNVGGGVLLFLPPQQPVFLANRSVSICARCSDGLHYNVRYSGSEASGGRHAWNPILRRLGPDDDAFHELACEQFVFVTVPSVALSAPVAAEFPPRNSGEHICFSRCAVLCLCQLCALMLLLLLMRVCAISFDSSSEWDDRLGWQFRAASGYCSFPAHSRFSGEQLAEAPLTLFFNASADGSIVCCEALGTNSTADCAGRQALVGTCAAAQTQILQLIARRVNMAEEAAAAASRHVTEVESLDNQHLPLGARVAVLLTGELRSFEHAVRDPWGSASSGVHASCLSIQRRARELPQHPAACTRAACKRFSSQVLNLRRTILEAIGRQHVDVFAVVRPLAAGDMCSGATCSACKVALARVDLMAWPYLSMTRQAVEALLSPAAHLQCYELSVPVSATPDAVVFPSGRLPPNLISNWYR
jgi:hypothetical protein